MGMRLIMTRDRVGTKMKLRALNAERIREHRAMHHGMAEQMRAQAVLIEEQIKQVSQNDPSLPAHIDDPFERETWLEQATKHVLHLQTGAMEQENATCLDDH